MKTQKKAIEQTRKIYEIYIKDKVREKENMKVIINIIKHGQGYDVIIIDESGSFCFKFNQERLNILAGLCNKFKTNETSYKVKDYKIKNYKIPKL